MFDLVQIKSLFKRKNFKEDMEYICNEISFSLKNEGNSDKCNNMDDSGGYCTDWNKPVTKRHDFTYMRFPESANS